MDASSFVVIELRNEVVIYVNREFYINNKDSSKCCDCDLNNKGRCLYRDLNNSEHSLCINLYYLGYKFDYSYKRLEPNFRSLFLTSKIRNNNFLNYENKIVKFN